jgi:hypothetical protein
LALRQIGKTREKTPKLTVPALMSALRDEQFDVRWLVSEALFAIGDGTVRPRLCALMEQPDEVWLRESAHHVLCELTRQTDYCQLTAGELVKSREDAR